MTPPTHSIYWDLPILIAVVSLIYSATRYDGWGDIFREAVLWGMRMAAFLGGIGLALFVLAWWIDSSASWWVLIGIAGAAVLVIVAALVLLSKKRDAAT
jgi:hypothetical protein